jgi:predicted  nucleic acid-binding Zn-ribbon protein
VPGYDKNKDGKLSYMEKGRWYLDYKDDSRKLLELDLSHNKRQLRTSEQELKVATNKIKKLSDTADELTRTKNRLSQSTKSLEETRKALTHAKALTKSSNLKYDSVEITLKTMEDKLTELGSQYQATLKQLSTAKEEIGVMAGKYSTSNSTFLRYRVNATNKTRLFEQQVSRLENEIEMAYKEVTALLTKIEQIEKNEETSLSQAVINVRDSAFNTAFPNLGGVTETQSRGLAFFAGLILVSFMIGRIE